MRVLALIAVEPRLHSEVRLSAPLVQFVPRFVPRLAVVEYSLKQTKSKRVLNRIFFFF